MIEIVSILLMLAWGAWFCWRAYKVLFRGKINDKGFMKQIVMLISANNIDRSIKLCNAEPSAWLPKAIKHLLCRANRIFELELSTQEALFSVRQHRPKTLSAILSVAQTGLFVLLMVVAMPAELDMSQWLLGGFELWLAILLSLGVWVIDFSAIKHVDRCEEHVLKLRWLLYGRGRKRTPQRAELVDMDEADIEAWRAAMEEIISMGKAEAGETGEKPLDVVGRLHEQAPKDEHGVLKAPTKL